MGIGAGAAILEEIHASGCNGGACHAQMYTMGTVLRHGSDAQKETYLPQIASGARRLQAFGVTEPTTGSDTTQLRTTAERRADGDYTVNGQKVWISRAEHSDLLLLLARTTPAAETKKRTEGPLGVPGGAGARGGQGSRNPADPHHDQPRHHRALLRRPGDPRLASLIGEEGRGFRYILDGMNAERILIAAECIGDCRWFIEKASAYASERQVFGRPIGANQGVQFPIAEAYAQMEAARLMVQKAAALFDAGRAWRARGQHGEVAGGGSLLESRRHLPPRPTAASASPRSTTWERKFREARLYRVAPISTNLVLAYLGQHVLGMPRSY